MVAGLQVYDSFFSLLLLRDIDGSAPLGGVYSSIHLFELQFVHFFLLYDILVSFWIVSQLEFASLIIHIHTR